MGSKELENTVDKIRPLDQEAMAAAQNRLDQLTKPPGSLGVLEDIARQVAGITGQARPECPRTKCCILMAADHGVVAEGVSAFPPSVTPQMVRNFARGGAAMNVLARRAGSRLLLVDIGVAVDLPEQPGLLRRKVAYGTANMARGPAMSRDQALAAISVGLEVVNQAISEGAQIIGLGEMGIGNTTASSALVAAFTGCAPAQAVGRGTGIDPSRLAHKVAVVERALEVNRPRADEPLDTLARVGGLEIAGLVGVILGAAATRVPVVTDGFISTAAALTAVRLAPTARDYILGSHLSEEPGHGVTLEAMGIEPVLHMRMRLGEGTGAALVMPLVDAALAILDEMATFEEARVDGAL